MVKPKLIHAITIEVLQVRLDEEMDDVWGAPVREIEDIINDPKTPRVTMKAQINFDEYNMLDQTTIGNDPSSAGYGLITERSQERYQLRVNDFIMRIIGKGGKIICSDPLRITQVEPVAQRSTFGLFRFTFKRDKRGQT